MYLARLAKGEPSFNMNFLAVTDDLETSKKLVEEHCGEREMGLVFVIEKNRAYGPQGPPYNHWVYADKVWKEWNTAEGPGVGGRDG